MGKKGRDSIEDAGRYTFGEKLLLLLGTAAAVAAAAALVFRGPTEHEVGTVLMLAGVIVSMTLTVQIRAQCRLRVGLLQHELAACKEEARQAQEALADLQARGASHAAS